MKPIKAITTDRNIIPGCQNIGMKDLLEKTNMTLGSGITTEKISDELARLLNQISEKVSTGDTRPTLYGPDDSPLAPWPLQIMLTPSNAPFLNKAEILVIGNCIPFLFPTLPEQLLENKVILMGCPNLDTAERHINKFSRIFRNGKIQRIATLTMEVHCCEGLNQMVEQGRSVSGVRIPMEKIILDRKGNVLNRIETP